MIQTFLVMAGGALGAAARYHLGRLAMHWFGPGFPWGTLAVNLLGGFAMGLMAGILARTTMGEPWRLLLAVGVLGGFTTFSAFSLESWLMIERGEIWMVMAYVLASVAGAIAALGLGLTVVRAVA